MSGISPKAVDAAATAKVFAEAHTASARRLPDPTNTGNAETDQLNASTHELLMDIVDRFEMGQGSHSATMWHFKKSLEGT